jgi:hypothetical protein
MTDAPDYGYDRDPRVYGDPSAYPAGSGGGPGRRRSVDAGRLWAGGIMAAVVAAGVAIVGLLVARGIADIPVLVERDGQLVDADTWWYAAAAAGGTLLATGLLHLLLLAAPRPYLFFGWMIGLATAIAALLPFTTGADLDSKIATSAINLAIGICIGSILAGVGRSAAEILDEPGRY